MKSNYLEKLFESMNFAAVIPHEELNKLLKRLNSITVKKDEYFLMAGEIPQRIGFNLSGLMRLFYIDNKGTEIVKHFCQEKSAAISYSAFLLRKESKLYIQALENTKLLTIDYETYCEILDSHACWQIASRKLAEFYQIRKIIDNYIFPSFELIRIYKKIYIALFKRAILFKQVDHKEILLWMKNKPQW